MQEEKWGDQKPGQHPDFPKRREDLVEGVHYYFDGGLFVFTELYHRQRGYCCGNNCRHCAYRGEQQP